MQHARAREQFGRPIGAFPAVGHPCADLPARAGAARAAVGADGLATARLRAEEAAVRGARDCLQACGGTGFTCC
ncbi:acyl-CoA dehydrogenase family protein [Streptomyces sp. NPDC017202]|uniref:acyl-CoA dehydrogenase family protein n=1 Tax=Streptomyces sp. NPDC017202 TaxID=3364981 RepID=UPI0037AFC409